jgi:hypothetical protein
VPIQKTVQRTDLEAALATHRTRIVKAVHVQP